MTEQNMTRQQLKKAQRDNNSPWKNIMTVTQAVKRRRKQAEELANLNEQLATKRQSEPETTNPPKASRSRALRPASVVDSAQNEPAPIKSPKR